MKNIISAKLAGNILLSSLGLLLVFHILVLLKILPATILWGGQATSANLAMLEFIALVVTIFFGLVIAAKTGYIKPGKFSGVVNVLTWVIFIFRLLNTLGISHQVSRLKTSSSLPLLQRWHFAPSGWPLKNRASSKSSLTITNQLINSPYAAKPVARDCEASRFSGISWVRAT